MTSVPPLVALGPRLRTQSRNGRSTGATQFFERSYLARMTALRSACFAPLEISTGLLKPISV